jgi:hypothetical protein
MPEQIRHNEEHRKWAGEKILALARSILSGESGIAEGSRHLAAWRFDVGAENDSDFIFFVGVDSETDHLPIGPVRQHWNPDALRVKDAELAAYEAKVQEKAFEVCRSLIHKYDIRDS